MSTAAANVAPAQDRPQRDELDALFAELDVQRRAAIAAFWRTLLKILLGLPFTLMPALPLASLFIQQPMAGVQGAFVEWMQSWSYFPHIAFGGLALVFVGLFLLQRYYMRHAAKPKRAYLRDYKQRVFNKVCELHFPGLRYDVDGYIGYDEFEATQLFPYDVDRYSSEDYFEGRVGLTDIRFAEATVARQRRRLTSKGTRTYYENYFRGIVFVADFHKHFHSNTRMVPAGETLPRVRGQHAVALEDPEFSNLFTTVSTDQTDVRYLLTPSIMQRFVELHRRFPKLRAKLQNEHLLLMLPAARDHFRVSIHSHPSCKRQIGEFVRDLRTIIPVVEELNLNTRIWSKD